MGLEINPLQSPEVSQILTLDLMPSDVVIHRPLIDRVGTMREGMRRKEEERKKKIKRGRERKREGEKGEERRGSSRDWFLLFITCLPSPYSAMKSLITLKEVFS